MYIVIFCSLITLLLTYLESKNQLKGGMKWGFVIVAILGMIHYDYGSDYMSYFNLFKQVTSYSFNLSGILAGDYYRELGWVLLCWLFKPIGGFFMMVAVLNLIQNYIVFNFVKQYVDKRWWAVAVFVYLFATSFYLMSFSMMRQSFVIFMFLGMWRYIEERKWWIPLLVFWLLSFIHSSALILMPFAFWGFLPVNKGKVVGISYALLLLLLWFSQNFLNNIFSYALTLDDDFSQYADKYGSGNNGLKIGMGFVANMIPFVLSILFLLDKKQNYSKSHKLIISLAAISYLITPFAQIIPLTGRLGMYFGIYQLGSIPLIYSNIRNKVIRAGLLSLCLFMIFYDYIIFFSNPVWVDKYTDFHTIFEVL